MPLPDVPPWRNSTTSPRNGKQEAIDRNRWPTIIPVMRIDVWWPLLSDTSRQWLVEHNGEPLDQSVKAEIFDVNDGDAETSWWAGDSSDGLSELTDDAIDWIEAAANKEQPSA
ncbi:MAG: hypothetical protein AB1925_02615 [Actinomycetota bacterium]